MKLSEPAREKDIELLDDESTVTEIVGVTVGIWVALDVAGAVLVATTV